MRDPEEFWGNIIGGVVAAGIAAFVVVIIIALTSDHRVRGYYLNSISNTSGPSPKIVVDIDWQADESIYLDKDITFQQAIQMVDSLNATLRK